MLPVSELTPTARAHLYAPLYLHDAHDEDDHEMHLVKVPVISFVAGDFRQWMVVPKTHVQLRHVRCIF